MRKQSLVQRAALSLAALGMCVPSAGFAGTPVAPSVATASAPAAASTAVVTDIAVSGSTLTGTLLSSAGQPVDGALVSVFQGDERVATTTTGRDGTYSLAVSGGQHYVVVANGAQQIVRVWDATIAPPAARQDVVLVQSAGAVRGQDACYDACAPAAGCGIGGGGFGGGGVILGAAGLVTGAVLGGIAISKANDAEDEADAAADKATANMMRLNDQEDAINSTRARVNEIQDAIDDADDFDDLQDTLGDLDDLDLIGDDAVSAVGVAQ